MNLTQPTFNLVAVVRHPDDYDPMEGGGKLTSVHVLCEKVEPNGVSGLFVINALNSGTVMDGTLNEHWRQDVVKAGVDPVFAIGAAQTLAETMNSFAGKGMNHLPAIAEVMAERFPDRKMPFLRMPSVALNLA